MDRYSLLLLGCRSLDFGVQNWTDKVKEVTYDELHDNLRMLQHSTEKESGTRIRTSSEDGNML